MPRIAGWLVWNQRGAAGLRSMVRQRMGLLDDAIREHLELKRLRGADPALVLRQEREVLRSESGGTAGGSRNDTQAPVTGGDIDDARPDGASQTADASRSQETAELDMRALLQEEPDRAPIPAGAGGAAPVRAKPQIGESAYIQTSAQDLEWEMHEEDSSGTQGEVAKPASSTAEVDEPAEDVLEETPDFLRDTPEQEQLWFEQRPPRDFDFDR